MKNRIVIPNHHENQLPPTATRVAAQGSLKHQQFKRSQAFVLSRNTFVKAFQWNGEFWILTRFSSSLTHCELFSQNSLRYNLPVHFARLNLSDIYLQFQNMLIITDFKHLLWFSAEFISRAWLYVKVGCCDVSEEHSVTIFRVKVNILFYPMLHNFRKSVAFEGSEASPFPPSDKINISMIWVWSFDGKILTGEKAHVLRKTCLDVTLSTVSTWTGPGLNSVLLGDITIRRPELLYSIRCTCI